MAWPADRSKRPVCEFGPIFYQRLEQFAIGVAIAAKLSGGCVDVALDEEGRPIVKRMCESGIRPYPL